MVADFLVPLERACCVDIKPSTEFFVNDPLHVSSACASAKPGQDRSDLGLILVGIVFKVDSDGIVLEEERSQTLVERAIFPAERFSICLDLVSLARHV
jgi:hypothetical protein